jgi:hypothetical protein
VQVKYFLNFLNFLCTFINMVKYFAEFFIRHSAKPMHLISQNLNPIVIILNRTVVIFSPSKLSLSRLLTLGRTLLFHDRSVPAPLCPSALDRPPPCEGTGRGCMALSLGRRESPNTGDQEYVKCINVLCSLLCSIPLYFHYIINYYLNLH